MDRNVIAAQRLEDGQGAANAQACHAEALMNGHTIDEADWCDEFSVDCVRCPFRPRPTQEQLEASHAELVKQVDTLSEQLRLLKRRERLTADLIAQGKSAFTVGQIITSDNYAKAGKAFRVASIGAGYTPKGGPRIYGRVIRKDGTDGAQVRELFMWDSTWRLATPDEIPGGAK